MPELNFAEGETILIDKPIDWTSFDVVNKLKFALKKKYGAIKIGHAGTLDPKATGLLILCTGKKTKDIQQIQDADKTYTGTFFLGATTECYDSEKDVNQTFDISTISQEDILKCAESFIGEQEQFPPAHSAVKINGKRAYELARQGKEVEIKSKKITIKSFEISAINLPLIEFKVICTKGTYIRSLANDFGKKLNNGAYLHSLRRTQIGNYRLEDAFTVEQIIEKIK
ncbi:MAG: tRNA pseudouridine(55) synthase TruB [Bacteroidota bacterium]|jgi:tRNA pseudouridine55 synthase